MAYTYNDVPNAAPVFASGDTTSEIASGSVDLKRWADLQQAFMPGTSAPLVDMGTETVASAADQAIAHISSVSKAAIRMSETQSVANIHVNSDNFIRESITGK